MVEALETPEKEQPQVETKPQVPDILVRWLRSQEHIPFTRPLLFLILGMRGSGKSSLLEVLAIRYPKIIDIYGCYDEKTELLTKDGWVSFKDVSFDDEVATLNQNGFLEYHKPLAIQKYRYKGEMIHFTGKRSGYDLLVTPDHQMYVKPVWGKNFVFRQARYLAEHSGTRGIQTYRLKRSAKWNCNDVTSFELPTPPQTKHTQELVSKYETAMRLIGDTKRKTGRSRTRNAMTGRFQKEEYWTYPKLSKLLGVHEGTIANWVQRKKNPNKLYHYKLKDKIPIDTFLRFLGWYLAEGFVHKINTSYYPLLRVEIAQLNPENIKEISTIAENMNCKWTYSGNSVVIFSKQLALYYKQFGYAHQKFIPKWVKQLPPKRLKVLIEAMLKGDGSRGCVYYTCSKQLADDFQEICIKAGYGASVTRRPQRKKLPKIRGREIKSMYPSYEVSIAWKTLTPRICTKPKVEHYEGWIYDVTVPNHVIMVRRNGKACWCGNSSDSEGLSWCKPEFEQLFTQLYGRPPRILLIVGNGMDVASKFDSVKIKDLKISDFEAYDVIITVYACYVTEKNYFGALQKITRLLWEKRTYWTEPWFVLVREASNWIYSRLKLVRDDRMAKADFIKALREARHHGLALGVDTLRWTSLDKEVRDLSDYIFLKRVGSIGLPDDLRWMYRYIRPYSMMQARPNAFMLVTGRGAVGYGRFDYPSWHKEEKENILRSAGVEVKKAEQALPDDRRYGVGDFEHAEIIMKYIELKSMHKTATALSRSTSTIKTHVGRHNLAVETKGECPKCHHANCEFSKDVIGTKR